MTISDPIVRPVVAAKSLQFDAEVLQFWAEEARIQRVALETVAAYLG